MTATQVATAVRRLPCCEHCGGDAYCAEHPDNHSVPCGTCRPVYRGGVLPGARLLHGRHVQVGDTIQTETGRSLVVARFGARVTHGDGLSWRRAYDAAGNADLLLDDGNVFTVRGSTAGTPA